MHLADNEAYVAKGQPGHDPLYKLRPFLESFIANCQAAYNPNRELSVDEAMVGFKGRLAFIQYLPNKPTKWGMKAYVLADSITGYVLNWRLYTGAFIIHNIHVFMHTILYIHTYIQYSSRETYMRVKYTRE